MPFFNPDDLLHWKKYSKNLPKYTNGSIEPHRSILVHFDSQDELNAFANLVQQKITDKTKYIYYPKLTPIVAKSYRCQSTKEYHPEFPVYIVSKGRWESRLTSKALERLNVNYFIVVEEQEYKNYAKVISPDKILILDKTYQKEYDTFDDLGNQKSKGPGPARNFAWDHSINNGFKWHWVMDDNIYSFFRYNDNKIYYVDTGNIFYAMEQYVQQYENIVMAGPNYEMFIPRKKVNPPFILNTRIYSCNLIKNDIPFRWRGRYNEDTDLSLNILKAKLCTMQFNIFLQDKAPTQTVKGGNTAEFYAKEGTYNKSKMLKEMHPTVTREVTKFNRDHHYVDYSIFKKNKPILKKEEFIIEDPEYGMTLKYIG